MIWRVFLVLLMSITLASADLPRHSSLHSVVCRGSVPQYDANGNLTNDGTRVFSYDAFGKMIKLEGPLSAKNRYWYSSKELIPQAGIYAYGFRFYEPNLQRWLNRDPIGEHGGINLYRFNRDNPLHYLDPHGLSDALDDALGDMDPSGDPGNGPAGADFTQGLVDSAIEGYSLFMAEQAAAVGLGEVLAPIGDAMGLGSAAEDIPAEAAQDAAPAAEDIPAEVAPNATDDVPNKIEKPKPPCPKKPPTLYRKGKPNPGNLKQRPQDSDGISTRSTLSNPLPQGDRPVFAPGDDYFGIDTSFLPDNSIVPDPNDPFHFGIQDVPPDQIQQAVIPGSRGTFPQ